MPISLISRMIWDWRGLIRVLFVLISLGLYIFSAIGQGHWTWFMVASLAPTIIFGIIKLCDDDDTMSESLRTFGTAMVVCLALAATSVYPGPKNNMDDGFWLNRSTGANGVANGLLLSYPLNPNFIWVPTSYTEKTAVNVGSSDGIPMQCSVEARGLWLDTSDPEAIIPALMKMQSPSSFYGSELMVAIAAASKEALASKSTQEIATLERFILPYRIGTPLGSVLERLHLKWRDGLVAVNCRTVFNS